MKYNININQKGLEFDNKITVTEAAVIDWLHTFAATNSRKINANKVDGWTWVSCQFLIDDMPLLRIKSRSGGSRLLTRVAELGYIELKREPRKIFYRCTDKMDSLYVASEQQTGASKQQNWCPQATYHNTNPNTKSLPEADASTLVVETKKKGKDPLVEEVYELWMNMAASALGLERKDVEKSKLYFTIVAAVKREKWDVDDFKGLFKHFFADEGMKRENKLAYSICLSQTYIAKYKLAKKGKPKTFASISGDIRL